MLFIVGSTCALLGVAGGCTAAVLLLRRSRSSASKPEPVDEWTAAAIDQAAVRWVRANNLPDEAAGPVADKLRLLHQLGAKRGWH